MNIANAIIGMEVVRTKGDYVVGRVGIIIAVDADSNRAQIDWNEAPKSKVNLGSLEPTSIPYVVVPGREATDSNGKWLRFTPHQYQRK